MKVTVQEIVLLIEGLVESDACMGNISDKQVIMALELVSRIKSHGIAPPDGMVLVPIITEATTFNCKINGDQPQVGHAWTPPCKIWCGKKYCTPKVKP